MKFVKYPLAAAALATLVGCGTPLEEKLTEKYVETGLTLVSEIEAAGKAPTRKFIETATPHAFAMACYKGKGGTELTTEDYVMKATDAFLAALEERDTSSGAMRKYQDVITTTMRANQLFDLENKTQEEQEEVCKQLDV